MVNGSSFFVDVDEAVRVLIGFSNTLIPALVTSGCSEDCPFVPGLRHIDWPIENPKGQSLEEVRKIRDEIWNLVKILVEQEGLSAS